MSKSRIEEFSQSLENISTALKKMSKALLLLYGKYDVGSGHEWTDDFTEFCEGIKNDILNYIAKILDEITSLFENTGEIASHYKLPTISLWVKKKPEVKDLFCALNATCQRIMKHYPNFNDHIKKKKDELHELKSSLAILTKEVQPTEQRRCLFFRSSKEEHTVSQPPLPGKSKLARWKGSIDFVENELLIRLDVLQLEIKNVCRLVPDLQHEFLEFDTSDETVFATSRPSQENTIGPSDQAVHKMVNNFNPTKAGAIPQSSHTNEKKYEEKDNFETAENHFKDMQKWAPLLQRVSYGFSADLVAISSNIRATGPVSVSEIM